MNKKEFKNVLLFFIGAFLLALVYNVFMVSNNLVVGGVSGLAIVFNKLSNIKPAVFIMVVNIFLLGISFFTLGKERTIKNSFGTIVYPIFVNMTSSFSGIIVVNKTNAFVIITFACIFYGMMQGIIYKSGISSGGTDTIVQIISKYYKKPIGTIVKISNFFILLIGGLVFGLSNLIYAFICLYIVEFFTNRFVLGVSRNKMLMYKSKNAKIINDMIINNYKTGITKILPSNKDDQILYMTLASNKNYIEIRDNILKIDKEATIIVNNCHEIVNGTMNFETRF